MKIVEKDWNRMTDLVLTGKDGAGVAKVLKDKNKAIARFVSGLKLEKDNLNYNSDWKEFRGSFSEFGDKALKLGATLEEIQKVFDENEVPTKYSEKIKNLASKKLTNRFVGDISKKILDAGFDINYLPHSGNAITFEGKDAMSRNGRKWTIGYKTLIGLGDKEVKLAFDAITDEGDVPTSYVIDLSNSSSIFNNIHSYQRIGKLKFISMIMDKLNELIKT
jgi:hypothetical protein